MSKRCRVFLIIFCVFCSTKARCQSTDDKKIDSLLSAVNGSPEDTNMVKMLNECTYLLSRTDPQSSLVYSKKAIELSERLHYEKGLARALDNSALCSNISEDTAAARYYANRALSIAQKINDTACQVRVLTRFGYIAVQDEGRGLQGRPYAEQALMLAQASNNTESLAFAYMHMGFLLLNKKNDFNEAVRYDSLAIHLFDSLNDKYSQAGSLANLGGEYCLLKNHLREIEIDSMVLALLAPFGSTEYRAITLINLSDSYYKLQNYEKALPPCLEALKIDTRLGKKTLMADDNKRAAMAFYQLRQYDKADFYINAAIAIEQTIDEPFFLWSYHRMKKKIEKHL